MEAIRGRRPQIRGMGEQNLEHRIPPKVKVGQLVVLVEDVDGFEAGREGCIMGVRDDMVTFGCQSRDRLHLGQTTCLSKGNWGKC
jgi:hypothetical protein